MGTVDGQPGPLMAGRLPLKAVHSRAHPKSTCMRRTRDGATCERWPALCAICQLVARGKPAQFRGDVWTRRKPPNLRGQPGWVWSAPSGRQSWIGNCLRLVARWTRIAFISHIGESEHKINIVDQNGSNLITLALPGYPEDMLAWHPSGEQIALVSTNFHGGGKGSRWIQYPRLAPGYPGFRAGNSCLACAHAGLVARSDRLLYAASVGVGDPIRLFVAGRRSAGSRGERSRIFSGPEGDQPAWSPDGGARSHLCRAVAVKSTSWMQMAPTWLKSRMREAVCTLCGVPIPEDLPDQAPTLMQR